MSEIETSLPDAGVSGAGLSSTATLHPRLLLVLQAAVFMVSAEARVIAPLLPAIALEFQTSVAAAGMLITAYTIPYGLFQLVYGPLADRAISTLHPLSVVRRSLPCRSLIVRKDRNDLSRLADVLFAVAALHLPLFVMCAVAARGNRTHDEP